MSPGKSRPRRHDRPRKPRGPIAGVRIIGGQFRGRRIAYDGIPEVRPMKDRVREAVFNLVGPAVVGGHAIDLFAGTGALGLEALSRGAKHATFIERHFPTADLLRRNVALLGMEKKATVIPGDAFAWFHRRPELGTEPWLVFCSPPYDYYASRGAELRELMAEMIAIAPPGSVFVVEFDKRFEPSRLPQPEQWDIRRYPPAIVGVFRKP